MKVPTVVSAYARARVARERERERAQKATPGLAVARQASGVLVAHMLDEDVEFYLRAKQDVPALAEAVLRLTDGIEALASDFERKAKTLREMARVAGTPLDGGRDVDEYSRLADKASTYEAEARNLRALLEVP